MPLTANYKNESVQLFRALSAEFAQHASRDGVSITPYRDESLPHYSKLDPELQQAAINYLHNNISVFREFKSQSKSLLDSPQFIWRAINSLGYVPSSDIFDKIEKSDIVEVYTAEANQSFRSINFFTHSSLTLEELCSFPVHELIEFGEKPLAAIMEIAGRLRRNEITKTFDPQIDEYEWKEKFTKNPCSARTKIKWMSPARRSDGRCVLIVVNRSERVV